MNMLKTYSYLPFMMFFSTAYLANSQTVRINNFDELLTTLRSGENVRVVVNYGKCKLLLNGKEKPSSPDVIAGVGIDTYEYFAAGSAGNSLSFIVFSESKLIKNPNGKGYVYNYGKFKIYSDNSVEINARYLNPKNYKVVMDELFKGSINNGINEGGINLFK